MFNLTLSKVVEIERLALIETWLNIGGRIYWRKKLKVAGVD